MILRSTLKSVRHKPVRLVGTLVTYVLTLSCMLALISILVATTENTGPTYLLEDVDLAARVDVIDEFNIDELTWPESIDIRITEDQRNAINSIDGVENAAGYTIEPVSLKAPSGESLEMTGIAGTSWGLDSIVVSSGTVPEDADHIMLSDSTASQLGLVPNDRITLASAAGPREIVVSGTFVGREEMDQLLIMDDSALTTSDYQFVAIDLADGVQPDDVRESILALSGDHPLGIVSGDNLAKIDPMADTVRVADFGSLLGVMAGFMGFVSIFVMLGTIGFAIQQRAGQIAIERAVGYSPNQVRKAVVIESLIVSIIGTIAGFLLAIPIADVAVRLARSREIVPDTFEAGIHPLVATILLPSMMLVVIGVAWWASRRMLGISPVVAMRDARAPEGKIGKMRWIAGVLLIATGLVSVALSSLIPPLLALMFSLFLVIFIVWGISLVGPAIIRLAVIMLRPISKLGNPVVGSVAAQNTRRMASRVASGTTPIMLGAGFLIMMFFFTATMEEGAVEVSADRETAEYYVVSTAGPIPNDVLDRITSAEGVESASPMYFLEVIPKAVGPEDAPIEMAGYAVDRDAFLQSNTLDISEGSLEDWQPGTIIVSDYLSFDSNLKPGRSEEIVMPDGSTQMFEVVAIARNTMGAGDVFFHASDVQPYQASQNLTQIAINFAPEIDPDHLATTIDQLQNEGYPVQLLSRSEYLQGVEQTMNSDSWATYLIIGSAAALGMIASVNTLAMSTLDRSREFSLMRLVGATRRQVMGVALREGIMVGLIGVGGGVVLALLSAASVSVALVGDVSAVRVPMLPTTTAIATAFIVCVGAIQVPAHLALRKDPIEEIGTKE